jgi:hypothetical protein
LLLLFRKRRVFFSEEKKQKTFASCVGSKIRDLAGTAFLLTFWQGNFLTASEHPWGWWHAFSDSLAGFHPEFGAAGECAAAA